MAKVITQKNLEGRCELLERNVLRQKLATEAELAAHRPGGEQNTDTEAEGWLRWNDVLNRHHAKVQFHQFEETARARADRILADALLEVPRNIQLIQPSTPGGIPPTISVHPKSAAAITRIGAHDDQVALCAWALDHIREHQEPETLELLPQFTEEMNYHAAVILWIVTHPGPGLPFPRLEYQPDVPQRFFDMDAVDGHRLLGAYQDIHRVRMLAVEDLFASESTDHRRASWATFFAVASAEFKESPQDLMENRSLASVVVQFQLQARNQAQAQKDHKAAATPAGKGSR